LTAAVALPVQYYRKESSTQIPIKWMPPESVQDRLYTEKSDVWAFGVLCYEISSLARAPYGQFNNMDAFREVCLGYRLPQPFLCKHGALRRLI